MLDVTVVTLTKNEEMNLPDCLESIKDFVTRRIVIDSGSINKTKEIAAKFSAGFYEHPFENYARQLNWALDNTNIATKWTFRLDADERLTSELRIELSGLVQKCESDDEVNGFTMEAWLYFLGHKIKHGCHTKRKLMMSKTGIGRIENRKMDEHTISSHGRSVFCKHRFTHYNFKNMTHWVNKMNWYATREIQDYFKYIRPKNANKNQILKDQTIGNTRRLKFGLYYKLPIFPRSWIPFFYYYIIKLGFLDGKGGCVMHYMYRLWHRSLVDSRILERMIYNKPFEETGALGN